MQFDRRYIVGKQVVCGIRNNRAKQYIIYIIGIGDATEVQRKAVRLVVFYLYRDFIVCPILTYGQRIGCTTGSI